jgi:hypothetical protein
MYYILLINTINTQSFYMMPLMELYHGHMLIKIHGRENVEPVKLNHQSD